DLLISNIESLSVECHFKRTSRKLFNEKVKAVQYDLSYIQRNEQFL
ncbi:MAG UNVERIFIED_CONTAM: YppE family protein, partial [Staphylococcus saprophyticus]